MENFTYTKLKIKVHHQVSTYFSTDISAVKVLNHTTTLQTRHSGEAHMNRLTLEESQRNQKILLQVEGNVPQYELSCKRWCIIYYLS